MLVYRSGAKRLATREVLSDLEERIASLDGDGASGLDEVRSLLIDAGAVEAGLVDAECADDDHASPLSDALDRVMGAIADAFVRVWYGAPAGRAAVPEMLRAIREVGAHGPADVVSVSTPEGFAFYGLYPETYVHAAQALIRALAPRFVVVIGIRSIGTTLSAVVEATLRARGVATERLTVRPRGHPFDRQLTLSPRLIGWLRELAAHAENVFAVVDEGPGLSGSSFASVVESIRAAGVSEDRIAILPSWNPNADALSSDRARRIWPRHTRFVGDFDTLWLRSGRLEQVFDATELRELSAGAWRSLFFGDSDAPAIQPQHERRKFLARRADGERMLIKFEGLDRGVRERHARAVRAAAAGFAPSVDGLAHGFLATRWLHGTPLHSGDVTPELLRRLARYLAWISRCERTTAASDFAPLVDMLHVNALEALGPRWSAQAVIVSSQAADAAPRAPAVRVDGRMLPHEWLQTPNGYMKSDSASHFDDHFYPGETDVAWDVAATIIEFQLDAVATRRLLNEYVAASGDTQVEQRLPFMRSAYAAFRLGYTRLGAETLGASRDGERLREASRQYEEVLRRELSVFAVDGQSCATGARVPV